MDLKHSVVWRPDIMKVATWLAGMIFVAGVTYATASARVNSIEEKLAQAIVIQQGLVEALQQVRSSLEKLNMEMSLRVETARREHDAMDREIDRLRDEAVERQRRRMTGGKP